MSIHQWVPYCQIPSVHAAERNTFQGARWLLWARVWQGAGSGSATRFLELTSNMIEVRTCFQVKLNETVCKATTSTHYQTTAGAQEKTASLVLLTRASSPTFKLSSGTWAGPTKSCRPAILAFLSTQFCQLSDHTQPADIGQGSPLSTMVVFSYCMT